MIYHKAFLNMYYFHSHFLFIKKNLIVSFRLFQDLIIFHTDENPKQNPT